MFVFVIHCKDGDSPNYLTSDGWCADMRTAKTFEEKEQAVKEAKELKDGEVEYVWIGFVKDIKQAQCAVFVEEV